MNPKAVKILYWTLTILFALFMLMEGFGGITRQQGGIDIMVHLRYPIYVLSIFGIAKLLDAVGILQNKFKTIKEWAEIKGHKIINQAVNLQEPVSERAKTI